MTTTADRLRREGMADAAVHLVATRFHPHRNLEDWARALGLTQPEVKAAIVRLREKHQLKRPSLRSVPTGQRHGNAGRKIPSVAERRDRDERIRALRAEGRTLHEIAHEIGITAARVSQIVRASA